MMVSCKILILGGTGEAGELAGRLNAVNGLSVTLSLAGRTAQPRAQSADTRIGGFGGVEGLTRYLDEHRFDLLVDATHPFAARISANAIAAADKTGMPLVVLSRDPWERRPGDRWVDARDVEHAAMLLGDVPKTVFLAIGRQEVTPFAGLSQHRFVVRSVDPVASGELPPGATVILERGPFDAVAERRLLETHRVDIVVSKNSGGAATYGKIGAARALGLPVVMIGRPPIVAADPVPDVETAIERIRHLAGLAAERGE